MHKSIFLKTETITQNGLTQDQIGCAAILVENGHWRLE